MEVTSVGVDLGGLLRYRRASEFRAGAGLHYLRGRADVAYLTLRGDPWHTVIERNKVTSSLFAGFLTTAGPWTSWGVRLRAGFEVRKYLGAALPSDGFGPQVEVAGATMGIILGAELAAWNRAQAVE